MSLKKQTICISYWSWSTGSNASRCVFRNKQTRWTMEHASAVTAETIIYNL